MVTDHAPLYWLKISKMEKSRLTRWALALQPFSVEHQPGRLNIMADFLSRTQEGEQLEIDEMEDKTKSDCKTKYVQPNGMFLLRGKECDRTVVMPCHERLKNKQVTWNGESPRTMIPVEMEIVALDYNYWHRYQLWQRKDWTLRR